MAEIFSGISILRYELGVIGRASTNNMRVVLGPRAQCGPRWLKVALSSMKPL